MNEREFDQFEQNGDLPNLEFVRVMHDHTGNFGTAIDGVNTPELQTADNDYAVGRIVEAVAKSKLYHNNTLIFVVEDDAQDGPDHVDAHRSIALVAGQYVKQRAVISKRYTTLSMIATIVDILGMDHLGTYDANDQPMTDIFRQRTAPWNFRAIVPDILKTTQLPLPAEVSKKTSASENAFAAAYTKPRHDAAYWAAKTVGFDFNRLDAAQYNRIVWQGVVGENIPYPAARDGRDLRRNRASLLKGARKVRVELLSAPASVAKPDASALALQQSTKD